MSSSVKSKVALWNLSCSVALDASFSCNSTQTILGRRHFGIRSMAREPREPGVRFSKDPKTSRARKPPRKAPETTFGCFTKHPTTFDPEKYVIFPRKLHGYSLPPEKRFRVCFSCTCLIKWRPPTYFLGQKKWPRSCIKRERELRRGEKTMS